MNKKYKYSLDTSSNKYQCPACGHKTFVLYINNESGNPIHETVGRCDRENNCAHHYPPKQYFTDNGIPFDKKREYTPSQKPIYMPNPQPSHIDEDVFEGYLRDYKYNDFITWLRKLVELERTKEAIKRYHIGTYGDGGTVFFQIDLQGKIRAGKIIFFDETGHRRKDIRPPVDWIHNILNLPKPSQCFFGEHLLHDTTKAVAIVESEKTAIVASCYLPDFIWLACGSSNGLDIDKCKCLKGRAVVLYPDAGMFERWNEKAKELSAICAISVSSLVEKNATEEERKKDFDLADYLEKVPLTAQLETQTPTKTSVPIPQSDPTPTDPTNTTISSKQ